MFRKQIEHNFNDSTTEMISTLSADEAVKVFNNNLHKCCKQAIPKRRVTTRKVPWWNQQLTELRKKASLAKKQLTRARRLHLAELVDEYAETYRRLRNTYVSEIKKCKRNTWQHFVNGEANKKNSLEFSLQNSE